VNGLKDDFTLDRSSFIPRRGWGRSGEELEVVRKERKLR
jgi:hypothetical protein